LGGPAGSDETRQPLRAAAAGDEPERDLDERLPGAGPDHAHRAGERELQPATTGPTVDRCDDHLRHRLEQGKGARPAAGVPVERLTPAELDEILEVAVQDEPVGQVDLEDLVKL